MDFSLWSRAAVGQLIEQEFGIKLQVRSIGKYLARWGFTPQKPIMDGVNQHGRSHCRIKNATRADTLPHVTCYPSDGPAGAAQRDEANQHDNTQGVH